MTRSALVAGDIQKEATARVEAVKRVFALEHELEVSTKLVLVHSVSDRVPVDALQNNKDFSIHLILC